jgi:hypothetical protein
MDTRVVSLVRREQPFEVGFIERGGTGAFHGDEMRS